MLFKKNGFPEVDEIVYCVVTGVHSNSVFCNLEEYQNKSGLIHISEVSPGRIRNIRDYVKEGKVIFCKILRINKERGHIDLSLRRVSESQKRAKANLIKQENKAFKILELVGKEINTPVKSLHASIVPKVLESYDGLFSFFMAFVEDIKVLKSMKFPSNIEKALEKVICSRLQMDTFDVSGILSLSHLGGDGVNIIKDALNSCVDKGVNVLYISGGKYRLSINSSDYASAENIINEASNNAIDAVVKAGGEGEFDR